MAWNRCSQWFKRAQNGLNVLLAHVMSKLRITRIKCIGKIPSFTEAFVNNRNSYDPYHQAYKLGANYFTTVCYRLLNNISKCLLQ